MELNQQQLRSKALAMLTRREHSQYELHHKLMELGATAEQVVVILEEFKQQGWQSDRRFCEALIRSWVNKGQAELVIRQELKQRGITDKDLFDDLLAEYDWFALAQQVRIKKFGSALPLTTDKKEQARQCRFLQYRGFNSEQCWYAVKTDVEE